MTLGLGSVLAVLGGVASVLAAPGDGALSQLPGTQGCVRGVAGAGNSKCQLSRAVGLLDASSSAVSPDGRFVYVASPYEKGSVANAQGGTITVFSRNAATGAVTQLAGGSGCVMEPNTRPVGPGCSTAIGIGGAKTIALSPDGKNAYVAGINSNSVAAFAINQKTGALSQLPGPAACLDDPAGGECPAKAPNLQGVRWVTVSPDGKNVYTSSPARDTIGLFTRNPDTGAITPVAGMPCIEDYEAYIPGKCPVTGVALNYPRMLTVSPDGKNVYVASDSGDSGFPNDHSDGDAISEFARDPVTGRLTQLPGADACIKDVQAAPDTKCSQSTNGLHGAFAIKVSPDNKNAYAAADASDALTIFTRDPQTGALRQPAGRQTCFRDPLSSFRANCPALADGLIGANAIDISPDGNNVYVSSFYGSAIAAFRRNPNTGDVSQLAAPSTCTKNYSANKNENCPITIDGIGGVRDATMSPDGQNIYAPASVGQTLAVFKRDAPRPPTEPTPPTPAPAEGPGVELRSSLASIGKTGKLRLRLTATERTTFDLKGFVRAVGKPFHGTGGIHDLHAVQRIPHRQATLLKAGDALITIKLRKNIRIRLAHTRRAHLTLVVNATTAAKQARALVVRSTLKR